MRMVLEILAPRVKHGQKPHLRTKVLRVGPHFEHGAGCCLEEDLVDYGFILERKV